MAGARGRFLAMTIDGSDGKRDSIELPWQRIGSQALCETEPEKLKAKISAAEAAISQRLEELGSSACSDERHMLDDASDLLASLKKEGR
jgi:hypothetical protein